MFRFAITSLVILLAFSLYAWIVRPYIKERPEFRGFYDFESTTVQRVWAWIKQRWDFAVAAVIAVAPILWDSALDFIIAIAQILADALPAVAGLDLSAFIIPDWLKTSIQVGAALVPVIRGAMLKKTEG